jgi:hypothetical protein
VTENPGRDVATLRDMEAAKREYQVRCSHIEIALSGKADALTCESCGKVWVFRTRRGYSDLRKVFVAET